MLAKLTNWKTVIVLVVLILPFNVFIFPTRSAKLRELAGKNVPTIDSMFAYTPTQVYDVISDYGEQGRQHHAVTELTADLLYPILYSLLLSLLVTLIFRRAFATTSFMQKLWLLALCRRIDRLRRERHCCHPAVALSPETYWGRLGRQPFHHSQMGLGRRLVHLDCRRIGRVAHQKSDS